MCGLPSYVAVVVAPLTVTITAFGSILSVPLVVLTLNCAVTSFSYASFTTAVPVTSTVYSPASFPFADADNPLTVYVFPLIVNVVCCNPLTVCSVPSYSSVPLFATTSISYF